MTTLFILLSLAIIVFFIYKSFKFNKEITPEYIERKVAALKAENKKANTYPKFIPFYEWHGFIKGLHHENRSFVLTEGKKGKKPNKW
jgi:hypothetical protein